MPPTSSAATRPGCGASSDRAGRAHASCVTAAGRIMASNRGRRLSPDRSAPARQPMPSLGTVRRRRSRPARRARPGRWSDDPRGCERRHLAARQPGRHQHLDGVLADLGREAARPDVGAFDVDGDGRPCGTSPLGCSIVGNRPAAAACGSAATSVSVEAGPQISPAASKIAPHSSRPRVGTSRPSCRSAPACCRSGSSSCRTVDR